MSILVKAKELYDQCGIDMNADIAAYAAHGYVFITPDSFLLGKAVNSKSEAHPADQWNVENPDAWYVRSALNTLGLKKFLKLVPYPLPFVCWTRHLKNKPTKFHKFETLKRKIK